MSDKDGMLETLNELTQQDFPRHCFNERGVQVKVPSLHKMVDITKDANGETDAYYSVYSFPEGHPKNGHIPKVDTLFLDFDIADDHIYKLTESEDDWEDAINDLLHVVSNVAMELYMNGAVNPWRFALSGHKGVHMYLDFPSIDPEAGSFSQFKTGLENLATELMDKWERNIKVEVNKYADQAVLGDLSRLSRIPNTLHPTATERFDEPRYCVPVTAEEMIDIDATEYRELCSEPRLPESWGRNPSKKARVYVRQHIFDAIVNRGSDGELPSYGDDSNYKPKRIERYKANTKGNYDEIEDVWYLLADKPCIKAFYEGKWDSDNGTGQQFAHGPESHWMELFTMTHLINKNVPYELCVDFFSHMDGFDPYQTKERLNQLIGRSYSKMTCEKLWTNAPSFCLGKECALYETEGQR